MAQETNQTQAPLLCVTGCGFYGNPRTNGMCSVCYKDFLQRQNNNGRGSPQVSTSVSSLGESLTSQCTDSSLADVLPVLPRVTTPLDHSSQTLLAQASRTHSEESDSSGDKVQLKTEELKGMLLFPEIGRGCCRTTGPVGGKAEPKKNRCFMCRKKVGLTGFDCRCGTCFAASIDTPTFIAVHSTTRLMLRKRLGKKTL